MLPREMGHQNRVIVYVSRQLLVRVTPRGGKGQVIVFTRVAQRSLPREYHGPPLLLYPNGVTSAVRLEFALQLGERSPRGSKPSQSRAAPILKTVR
jgi:hypothetical protein